MRPDTSAAAPAPSAVMSRIERELRDMWSVAAPAGDVPRARACTMNLVVVASSEEIAERYVAIIDDVTRSIPARAIVVALDPEGPDTLEGDVTAVCGIDAAASICSERVRMTARGAVCARVASAVDALCVPELPTVLVWLGRVHVDDDVFLELARDSQRVLLDTEYTSLGSLLHLARWARGGERGGEGRPHVADLAWTRLAIWQEMCARFFDTPALREHASHVTRVTLRQACDPGARLGSEGALLLGWLGTRLGWKTTRVGGHLRFRRADGGNVAVSFEAVARPPGVAPSALAGVAFDAVHDGVTLRATLDRQLATGIPDDTLDADVLEWRLDVSTSADASAPATSRRGPMEQRVRLRTNQGARLLERTLHRPANDPALAEAAAFAEEMVEDEVVCT